MSLRIDKINSQIQKMVSEILLTYSEEIGFFLTYDERNCYMNADLKKEAKLCL